MMLITKESLPGPLTPNVLAPFGEKHSHIYEITLRNLIQTHGAAGLTTERAAAILAGLLVVAAAMGERPTRFHIKSASDGLPCLVFSEWKADYLSVPVNTETDPMLLMKIAIHALAGKAGEAGMGLAHGASLVLDVYRASIATTFLDFMFTVPMTTHIYRAIGYTNEVVQENEAIFFELFSALRSDGENASDAFHQLVDRVVRMDVRPLVGRSQ